MKASIPDAPRPDPDQLIEKIRADERRAKRGRLKVFLGMCPGVGKTYAMLQAAQRRQAEGVEVVVGVVETHGRAETAALLEGLPVVPKVSLPHRGTVFEEMDLEGILIWKPGLVLVDELAHSNVPGSRHPKRYQDVMEILDGGVDVFTTVNIQHIESRSEYVRRISGVSVRETVPDTVLDAADEIELVDVTPEQVRQRLQEGKVYLGERALAAADHFFQENRLAALRELALRFTAEHVERHARWRENPLREAAVSDLLLVGVSASPHSAQLLRWARRYAAGLEVPWIAVAVETPRPLSAADEQRRAAHLSLARELGAEVILAGGTSVAATLLRVARERRATHLILGKPRGPAWKWFFQSPVAWTIENSGQMDVQLIRTEDFESPEPDVPRTPSPQAWRNHAIVLGLVAAVTVVGLAMREPIGYRAVAMLYLMAVTVGGLLLPRRHTLALAAISALCWDVLFIPPRFTLWISRPEDGLMFGMFFVVALVVGHLTARLRERERLEHKLENRSRALYELTRGFASADSLDDAVRVLTTQLESVFRIRAAVFLKPDAGRFDPHPAGTWSPAPEEETVAQWVFSNQRKAGHGTDTLPQSTGLHLPLLAGGRVEGVLSCDLENVPALSAEQVHLLETFASQFAVVAAKELGREARQRASVVEEAGRFQHTLFDSVSHELKTPLAALQAALDQPRPDPAELRSAANRLGRAVGQLLDTTRLESGLLQPRREWCDPAELVADALGQCGSPELILRVPPGLSHLRVDGGLITQALAILIHNATTHGASSQQPELDVTQDGDTLVFALADRGPGLPSGVDVFSKFQRGPGAAAGGLGLGLSIARHLAEMHAGTLEGLPRAGGGAIFRLRIPTGGPMTIPG